MRAAWNRALLIAALATAYCAAAQADTGLTGDAPEATSEVPGIIPLPPDSEGDADAVQAGATPRSRLVEEIVVTAQRREEAMRDVPIAVSAFSAEHLDARGLVTVRDLALVTPGLQFTDLAGYTLIYLRGIGTDQFIPSSDPSVATYIDGVYFPSSHSMVQSFGALERIEILKGPQGTLFGRNSTGGAINIITRDPGQTPESSVQVSYGRFNDFQSRVYSNIPLYDSFAFSLSGVYNRRDSYYTLDREAGAFVDERGLANEIDRGARLKLLWSPLASLDIGLTGMKITRSGPKSVLSVTTHPSPLGELLFVPAEEREYVATADSLPNLRADTDSIYGQIEWRTTRVDTRLLGSYYKVRAHEYTYDFDASARPLVTFEAFPEYQRFRTAELQFLSNDGTWGSSWLEWVGGAYYLRSDGGYDPAFLSLANSAVNLPTGELISLIPEPLLDLITPLLGGVPTPEQIGLYFIGVIDTESWSAFAQGTARLTDWMDLTLGARYQREQRTLVKSDAAMDNLEGGITNIIRWPSQSSTVSNVSPRVSLNLRPFGRTLIYLSWARGFKSATYNIVNIYFPPDFVEPEEATTWELGIKTDLFGNNLRLNAAVFQNTVDNFQTGTVSLTSGGAVNFENAGEVRVRGAEFDALWIPMPRRNPGLVVTASASYLDAIYTDFKNGSGFDETTGIFFGERALLFPGSSRDFSGNRVVRTPDWTASVGLVQTFDARRGSVEVGADYYYNNGYYYLPQNSSVSFEPSYGLLNARISYLHEPWNARLTVFGNNLTDERYNIAQFHTDFGRADTLAPPVTYGIRVNVEF